jgi:tRNA(fMet)-specific endonuclease VapC
MELIALDTSVLLDYYRSKDKTQTMLYRLSLSYQFAIPTIVMYEVLRGDKQKDAFWKTFFVQTQLLYFDDNAASEAANIYQYLVKKKSDDRCQRYIDCRYCLSE